MVNNKNDNKYSSYGRLMADIKSRHVGKCYIFHGEERYLLYNSLTRLRALLCPDGLDSFNYKLFDNNNFTIELFEEAVEVLPFSAERTLVEIHDVDLFKFAQADREQMCRILANLPQFVCVVFVYSAIEYNPDNRLKTTKEILKTAQSIDFAIQEESKLATWVAEHFHSAGKDITRTEAVYLTQITGSLMTVLQGEIEKVAAYAKERQIKRSDIDDVVTPVLDIETYRLADAIVRQDYKSAMQILDKLLSMREAPHKLMFGISLKMRQLLAACVCIKSGIGKEQYMKMSGIYSNYPAEIILRAARRTTLDYCKKAVLMCAQAAKELNSTNEPEARIIELVVKLAVNR